MAYDNYIGKHYSRLNGLLPMCKKYVSTRKKNEVKYFTLCAKEAVDIFLLEKEKIIPRDNKGILNNVIICESRKEDASEILKLVKPPSKRNILIGNLQDIILFTDDVTTRGRSFDEDEPNKSIRDKLRIKNSHEILMKEFPFDIINFDTCGKILSRKQEDVKLMCAFKKLFQLQEGIKSFVLAVTYPLSEIDASYVRGFERCVNDNISEYKEISDHIRKSWGATSYDEINEDCQLTLGFAKHILINEANSFGWASHHENIIVHESRNNTKMVTHYVSLYKSEEKKIKKYYIADVKGIISSMPIIYDGKDEDEKARIQKSLTDVRKYREEIRKISLN